MLQSHERGAIARINASDDSTTQKLKKMGITPGQSIAVEQRFPHFIVRVGNNHQTLDEKAINAIYVRIVEG
ncbi:MAG: ferrous iron transport protein A [Oscillatoriaceae cyanobacterium Prado104]|nr:ferrous iron transport protein A [Oscillatoriaceae cyanobacterium Prado104]